MGVLACSDGTVRKNNKRKPGVTRPSGAPPSPPPPLAEPLEAVGEEYADQDQVLDLPISNIDDISLGSYSEPSEVVDDR